MHVVSEEHTPQPLKLSEYGVDKNWVPVHVLTAEHTRFCVRSGAVVSHVEPSVQVDHAVHAVSR